MVKGIATAAGTLLIIILILYLAYVCTKYIGKGVGMKTRSKSMKIIDQMVLGRERSAAIVQIGERFFLIGITASQISLLSEIGKEDTIPFPETGEPLKVQPDFKSILEKIGDRKKKNGQ